MSFAMTSMETGHGVSAGFGARRVQRKAADVVAGSIAPSTAHVARMSESLGVQKKEDDVARDGFKGGGGSVPYQSEMERSFGADFSGVRAHTGADASSASTQLGAHAYTLGNDVAFRSASPDKGLVAHELTHVLQQGAAPARKPMGATSAMGGEAQANTVENAVRAGQSAQSVLGGGLAAADDEAQKKSGDFGVAMTFSKDGFKKDNEYTIWDTSVPPIPIFGPVYVKISPSVKVFGRVAADWGGKNAETMALELGVKGSVGIGLAAGLGDWGEIYATLNPTVTGAGTLRLGKEWSLKAGIKCNVAGKIGIKLAKVVDKAFQFMDLEMFQLTGLYFDKDGFKKDKVGFEWGKDIKAIWEAMEKAYAYGANAAKALADGAKDIANSAARTAGDFVDFITSW